MDTRLNTKRILIFLAFAFGISWAGTLAFYLTGGEHNRVIRSDLAPLLLNYVFVIPAPALAHVATRLITRQGWRHLWLRLRFRRGWPFYLAVWLLPLLAGIVGGAVFYLLVPQSFDPDVAGARNQLAGFPIAAEPNPWKIMLFFTPYLMIVQGLVGGVIAIGEEFGWRAYLLQRLIDHFRGAKDAGIRAIGADGAAARKAALLVGVIWGMWHWPGMFMGLGFDNTYPGAPFLLPLVYLVSTCSLSVLLSWATLRSGSAWPAALGHASALGASRLVMSVLKGTPNMLLGPHIMGLIGGLGFVALALVLLFSLRAFTGEKEASSERVPAVVVTSPG